MADFAEDARVRVSIQGLPFPAGVSLDNGPTITPEGVGLSGAEATAAKNALLKHPQVSGENVELRVLEEAPTEKQTAEEATDDEGTDRLAEVVGEQTAADLREQVGTQTLEEAQAAPSEELRAVRGIGPKTIEKIQEADAEVS